MKISVTEREHYRLLPKSKKKEIIIRFGSENAAFAAGLVVYQGRVMVMPNRPSCPESAFMMLDAFSRMSGVRG